MGALVLCCAALVLPVVVCCAGEPVPSVLNRYGFTCAAGKDDVGEGSERAALYQHLLVEFALTLLQGALKKGIINPRAPGAGECGASQPASVLPFAPLPGLLLSDCELFQLATGWPGLAAINLLPVPPVLLLLLLLLLLQASFLTRCCRCWCGRCARATRPPSPQPCRRWASSCRASCRGCRRRRRVSWLPCLAPAVGCSQHVPACWKCSCSAA